MEEVLLNAGSLFIIILFGFLLKRMNILSKSDGDTISAIIVNITLPAAIITNLSTLYINSGLLYLILVGFGLNVLMILVGRFFSKKDSEINGKFIMYCVSGYNIGNFTLPFTQSFLPGAVPLLAMFDIGNSVMLTGGTKAMIDTLQGEKGKISPGKTIRQLLSSVTFTTYLVMFLLRVIDFQLPNLVLSVADVMGKANTFLSMFMIGLYLDLYLPKNFRKTVAELLSVRYLSGIVLAVIVVLLPLPKMFTIVLCLLCVGPIATFGVINSVSAGVKAEAVGFTSSVSFLISFVLMTGVLMVLM